MGIRYWGRPLPTRFVATAQRNPRLLQIDDEYDDYLWALDDDDREFPYLSPERRHSLDLDKSFNDFQRLWDIEPRGSRCAIELVRGQVTTTMRGHRPHYGIVTFDRLTSIRTDVTRTGRDEISAFIRAGFGRYRDAPSSYVDSLICYRDAMLTFLDARLLRMEGVIYTIG